MFKRIKKIISDSALTTTIRHFTCNFVTVDGKEHSYSGFNYIDEDAISCSGPEYIMYNVRSDGYIKDDNDIMYPLPNIISISWACDDEIENVYVKEYKVFYTKDSKKKEKTVDKK